MSMTPSLVATAMSIAIGVGYSGLATAGDFSGSLTGQTSYGISSNKLQQQEWVLDLEYNESLFGGDLTAIGRVRWDSNDELNKQDANRTDNYSSIGGPLSTGSDGEVELREFYWDLNTESVFWRLGKQQVVWGEADGLKLLDVINPQNYREFILDDFDDSRIPLWMINAEISLDKGGVLQVLWIPDTSTHELAPAQSPYAFSSPVLLPSAPEGVSVVLNEHDASGKLIRDSDFGMRYTNFVGSWDISFNYLYHTVDSPVVKAHSDNDLLMLDQSYERSHLFGGTASTAFGDWTLRSEIAYETDRYHRTESVVPGVKKSDQWSTVIGLDWQGWTDQFLSMQWYQTSITGQTHQLVSKAREESLTFLWESKFFNETLSAEWLQIHSIDNDDGVVQLKLKYNYEENLDIYLSGDVFYGDEKQLFGQFDETDRVTFGFSWGF